ncbi:MAG: HAMP domain-containing protein [Anaeromyxobacter sp.]|nr:HAMP domain-containing protein [Anaeromyxobacter sp.]MBL0278694.1 HAMP domain-containing protein [Anaeromyxobacter sp.]
MAIGIFFPLALMGGVGWFWLRTLDDRLLSSRVAAVTAVAAHFDQELNGDLELLQRLASNVGPHLGQGQRGVEEKAVLEAFAHFRHREAIFLLDTARTVLAEAPAGRISAAPKATLPLVEEVLRTGLPRLSGLLVDARGALVHELVPVRDYSGAVVGVAGGTFDPGRRGFDRMMALLRRGQTGVAELVDAEGVVIASSEPRRTGRPAECAPLLAEMIREKRSGTTRSTECAQAPGAPRRGPELLTFTALTGASWGVVVRQSLDEALPTEGAIPWLAVAGILAGQLGLVGLFAWGAARSVTQPVAVLTAEAERIASGELAWPIPALGEDEVGRLGQALDRMRQGLKGLVESVEQSNERLEQRVRDRTSELKGANQQLRERELMRADLLRKVITAQEDERKRVARELHDETTQSLAVLLMRIERSQEAIRAGQDPGLEEVKVLATWVLDDVHRLILDLRPSVLDDLGLLSAIRWYAQRTLQERGVAVRFEFSELGRLPPELETALFRMCQETMSNIARHAQATQVLIEASLEAGRIHVTIEDDGKGFDQAEVASRPGRPHWGLLGIAERAELLGGKAHIDSSPGAGTRVDVQIPIPQVPQPQEAT